MEKETPLPYKIKFELKTEEERTFLRIALQKAHACAFGAIMDSRNDSELDEKTKQFNIERFSREMRLYARLLARLADATDEAEPWRAAGAGGGEEGRWKAGKKNLLTQKNNVRTAGRIEQARLSSSGRYKNVRNDKKQDFD